MNEIAVAPEPVVRTPIRALAARVSIHKAQLRKRRLLVPVEVDGRTFTEELVPTFAPYHRKLAADVVDVAGGKIVSVRRIDDVDPAMQVEIDGALYAIAAILRRTQRAADAEGKPTEIEFTELHCTEVGP